jgi:hypothetical protein
MQSSLRSPSLVALLCLCAGHFLSCGEDAAPPEGPDWLNDEEAAAEPEPPKPFVSPLDSYGNLKGRGETILGFELPFASREADHRSAVPVYYLMANEERMLRYYRSRGHVVVETSTGWRFQHSDRTLQALASAAEADSLKDAKIYARQGPGAGWTLIFDDGKPIATAKLPLQKLLDEVSPAVTQPGTAEPGSTQGEAPTTRGRPSASGTGSGRSSSGLSSRALRKLERAALQRPINTRRAKDVSARIYKHAKQRGQRFLD